MSRSSIEWTDATWNPTVGCTIISPGCTNCYAMRMAARLEAMGVAKYRGLTRRTGGKAKWNGSIRIDENSLQAPISWKHPQRIFVNSMSDLFHEKLSVAQIERVWSVMERCPHHIFQVLTKRAMRLEEITHSLRVLPNVWIGVSVENEAELTRVNHLTRANAAVKFVSFEPLLESVGDPDLAGVDWCIVGGESGPGARVMREEWVEDLFSAARRAGAAFHFKQWGGTRKRSAGRLLHGRTYDETPVPLIAAE